MKVVFGGAFQGKRDFVKNKWGITDADTALCSESEPPDISPKCICGMEKSVRYFLGKGDNPIDYITDNMTVLRDSIIICDDVCCGVVPLLSEDRLYRDNVGKILQILCRNADEVYRVYCGIPERLK